MLTEPEEYTHVPLLDRLVSQEELEAMRNRMGEKEPEEEPEGGYLGGAGLCPDCGMSYENLEDNGLCRRCNDALDDPGPRRSL